jgi:1,2-phenylacetyl-CoA epoxidase PaaB subunit
LTQAAAWADVTGALPTTTTAADLPYALGGAAKTGLQIPADVASAFGNPSAPSGLSSVLKSLGVDSPLKGLQAAGLAANLGNVLAGGPKLPGAAKTALDSSSSAVTNAQNVINSGGTGTPIWQTQKASIDASITQQLQHATEQLRQNAANTGQSGAVVQQQLTQLQQQFEQQRQALYLQAQQSNVQSAISELTGGNQTLSEVAKMQLAASGEAQSSLSEAAKLAAELASKG